MKKGSNGLSIAGFVVSLVGLVWQFAWPFGAIVVRGIAGVAGFFLSEVGFDHARIDKNSTGLAIAGMVIGGVATLLTAITGISLLSIAASMR